MFFSNYLSEKGELALVNRRLTQICQKASTKREQTLQTQFDISRVFKRNIASSIFIKIERNVMFYFVFSCVQKIYVQTDKVLNCLGEGKQTTSEVLLYILFTYFRINELLCLTFLFFQSLSPFDPSRLFGWQSANTLAIGGKSSGVLLALEAFQQCQLQKLIYVKPIQFFFLLLFILKIKVHSSG